MFEEYKNKLVKVVIKDGDNIKSYRGTFLSVDDNFIEIRLENGKRVAYNREIVSKIRLDEDDNENGRKNRY